MTPDSATLVSWRVTIHCSAVPQGWFVHGMMSIIVLNLILLGVEAGSNSAGFDWIQETKKYVPSLFQALEMIGLCWEMIKSWCINVVK